MTRVLLVESIYGADTKIPLVQLTTPRGETLQFVTEEARGLAMQILAAAEAAEGDAFVIEYLLGRGASQEAVGTLLVDFRDLRIRERNRAPG